MKTCQFCGGTSPTGNHFGPRKHSKATPTICYECVEHFFEKQTTPKADLTMDNPMGECVIDAD